MQNELVSVIVPSFNAELFIGDCLDSLINQTYSALEIICVDDGSVDSTYHILQKYQSKDRRIKLLKQNNKFAGVARNCGIREAKGKYLLFVDADDFCRLDMVETLVKKAESDQTDILIFDLMRYDNRSKKAVEDSWTSVYPEHFGEGVKGAVDIKDTIFQITSSGPMNKLFLREFIITNEIWFQSIPRTNDLFFVYTAMTYAKRIAILNQKLQYYRINNSSSLQATNDKTPLCFLEALQGLKDNLVNRGVYEWYKASYTEMAVAVSMFNLAAQKSEDTYIQVMDAIWHRIEKPDIGLCSVQAGRLELLIQQGVRVIIYGAGKLAEVFVKYLLFIKHINKERIKIVVTQRSHIQNVLCGISVKVLSELTEEDEMSAYVVAVDNKGVQCEMIKNLQIKGIDTITAIDFKCMLALLGMRKTPC
ncbi:MAG: glycosyltransferase [Lachnospiraceae bacterium]|nr:glycosyltransferase [Lachnospiraceae bacterium]